MSNRGTTWYGEIIVFGIGHFGNTWKYHFLNVLEKRNSEDHNFDFDCLNIDLEYKRVYIVILELNTGSSWTIELVLVAFWGKRIVSKELSSVVVKTSERTKINILLFKHWIWQVQARLFWIMKPKGTLWNKVIISGSFYLCWSLRATSTLGRYLIPVYFWDLKTL